ncbi:ATP-binding protein [Streptomyces sp. LD120]|uniref:ATP-binding protein n=1 Tax=Streptomyces physcomitrii TaxID=2724184 RepID=A0ABX1H3H8_9ACTN|nr:ATP-binding protein [Streptomyces physcomitrii]
MRVTTLTDHQEQEEERDQPQEPQAGPERPQEPEKVNPAEKSGQFELFDTADTPQRAERAEGAERFGKAERVARAEGSEDAEATVRPERSAQPQPQPQPQSQASDDATGEAVVEAELAGGAAALGLAPAEAQQFEADPLDAWDDGLIARRAAEDGEGEQPGAGPFPGGSQRGGRGEVLACTGELQGRLEAMRELVGLSRTRLDADTLAEAVRVLEESDARRRLSGEHTVIAVAGATGSGKSALFNALAGVTISETGVRRPTTALPLACSWGEGSGRLLDRLGIPARLRRRPVQSPDAAALEGMVLVDLPDHDSAAPEHREQVDRILELVDAVIWVLDPEKYADAMLHERYLRPMAGHAEVTFLVLNQVDRLPGDSADLVLDDLRRLLDEDGVALGEHGEPGATVLAVSALSGAGVGELRECLGQFVQERGAAARRIAADLDAAAVGLRPVYEPGPGVGLSEEAREEFGARLADSVGALAAGETAERAWRRNAGRACGTPWLRLWRWAKDMRGPEAAEESRPDPAQEEAAARQRVEQAVRTLSDRAAQGLPAPWAQAVREAAARGAEELPEALDRLSADSLAPGRRPPKPGWWPAAVLAQGAMTLLQVVGALWLLAQIARVCPPNLGIPALLMVLGILGGPLVEWTCRIAARGPARRYGAEAERRLREAAGACGRARVLEPVASELLRYREVREQYAKAAGAVRTEVYAPSREAYSPSRVRELSTSRR